MMNKPLYLESPVPLAIAQMGEMRSLQGKFSKIIAHADTSPPTSLPSEVLFSIDICCQLTPNHSTEVMLHHTKELNIRLNRLSLAAEVNTSPNCVLSFQTRLPAQASADELSHMLDAIAQDLNMFRAYANLHLIKLPADWRKPYQDNSPDCRCRLI